MSDSDPAIIEDCNNAAEHKPVQLSMLHHGGRLRVAAREYGIEEQEWLDLSTGINPYGWPLCDVPASCWQRLPEADDGLEQLACDYYGVRHILPVAGSQAAIQALPRLRAPLSRVAVLHPGYAEHAEAWQREGHQLIATAAEQIDDVIKGVDVLVLIQPNNPTGERFSPQQLLDWHRHLSKRKGWLIIDEAFIDTTPEHSICPFTDREGLIVLRSLGKFFGLAGARVGFVCGHKTLLAQLNALLGPWTVSGPARRIAKAALMDRDWQCAARKCIKQASTRLAELLIRHGLHLDGGCGLFYWVKTPHADRLHKGLAQQGILTRLFDNPSSVRFGLPGSDASLRRLDKALLRLVTKDGMENTL